MILATVANPTALANIAGSGVDWTIAAQDRLESSDDAYAEVTLAAGESSNILACTGFDFTAIPSASSITGVAAAAELHASTAAARIITASLIVDGSVGSVNPVAPTGQEIGTAPDVVVQWGGIGQRWNLLLCMVDLTATFGFALQVLNGSVADPTTVYVDHLPMTIYSFSPAGGGAPYCRTRRGFRNCRYIH